MWVPSMGRLVFSGNLPQRASDIDLHNCCIGYHNDVEVWLNEIVSTLQKYHPNQFVMEGEVEYRSNEEYGYTGRIVACDSVHDGNIIEIRDLLVEEEWDEQLELANMSIRKSVRRIT